MRRDSTRLLKICTFSFGRWSHDIQHGKCLDVHCHESDRILEQYSPFFFLFLPSRDGFPPIGNSKRKEKAEGGDSLLSLSLSLSPAFFFFPRMFGSPLSHTWPKKGGKRIADRPRIYTAASHNNLLLFLKTVYGKTAPADGRDI